MAQADISSTGEGTFQVSGDLVFSTVAGLLEKSGLLLAEASDPIVDLASVVNCDSAGLALLLEWITVGTGAGKPVRFRNLPEALVGIARLSNAEKLLPLAH